MHESNNVKLIIFAPESHAQKVRQAMGEEGGGKIGKYSHCSFTIKGTGRFKPEIGADPAIGKVGKLEAVAEERIEMVCEKNKVRDILEAVKKVHPYEEVAYDIHPLLDL